MKNILVLLFITVVISACSGPKPAKISFTGNMQPLNLGNEKHDDNFAIKSSQTHNCWSRRFVYSIDEKREYSPEFFYAIAHADKIMANIKSPFINFVFSKVQSDLRSYGATAQIELLIEEGN